MSSNSSTFEPKLLYSRCWEDHDTLRRGLRIQPGDRVLSIASAGDNSFALLLDDPASVTMLDRNTTQLALCRLKIACIRQLEPRTARRFLGYEAAPGSERLATFEALASELPERDRATLRAAPGALVAGICNVGKFERYLASFRRFVLPLVQWPSTVRRIAEMTDLGEQRALYEEKWDSRRWRTLFRIFFGRRVMERRGRQKEFFDHVEEQSVGDVFRRRAKKALTEIPAATNPYLTWVLVERNIAPPYLDEAHYATIRERVDRLEIYEDDLEGHFSKVEPGAYDAFNLSDCFEYMSKEASDQHLAQIVRASRSGARLVYWNLLVPRDGADVAGLTPEPELSKALHRTDRAFFYGRLVVERVTAPG